jgi:hypothetical protein
MYRPSGITVVTAGLGALVLVHVVASWGTKQTQPSPQRMASTAGPALDIGTAFQLHSGAWRARHAAGEEGPSLSSTPVGYLAPEAPLPVDPAPAAAGAPAVVPTEADQSPVRKVPAQPIASHLARSAPVPLEPAAADSVEPPAPIAETQPAAPAKPALPAGRMALSGPESDRAHPPEAVARHPEPPARSAPKAHEPAPAADAAPVKPKFGHEIFKLLDAFGS